MDLDIIRVALQPDGTVKYFPFFDGDYQDEIPPQTAFDAIRAGSFAEIATPDMETYCIDFHPS